MNSWEVARSVIKPFLVPILLGFSIIALLLWLKPSLPVIVIGVALLTLFLTRSFKDVVVNSLVVLAFYGVFRLLGPMGFWGLVLAVIVFVLVLIYRRRKLFIRTLEDIEKIIYKEG